MKIVFPSTFQAYFQGSQVHQKASKIGSQIESKTAKCQNMAHPKKRLKTDPQQVVKMMNFVSKFDEVFVAVTIQKSLKFINSQKWTPGTSRDPKGTQKVSKRPPKGIQKASKRRPN